MRRLLNGTAVVLGGMALVAATQGVAGASTTSASGATEVPSCVTYQEIAMGNVWANITNNCSTTQRATVQYGDRIDPTCYTLQPGETKTSYIGFNWNRVTRLVSC
ncbi:hypothetical protein [Streptomyces sp. NPDC050504]|uniref:hypothetical protein n=1 Tax=Streptomyces sp. NPDC050504 TaxID=3365618 RepID=UPI0037A4B6C6